jgi:hypothetical protein
MMKSNGRSSARDFQYCPWSETEDREFDGTIEGNTRPPGSEDQHGMAEVGENDSRAFPARQIQG